MPQRKSEENNYTMKQYNAMLNANTTCESNDVIYVITFAVCNEYYISETSNTLRVRKQHINSPEYRQIHPSTHLETCETKTFSIFPFYELRNSSAFQRREKDYFFLSQPRQNVFYIILKFVSGGSY